MSVIAIAGGTGSLGRTIAEALAQNGTYKVIILSRKPNPDKEAEIGAPLVVVDYENVQQIAAALHEHQVGTVISTLNSSFGIEAELNLIEAANQSPSTNRYVANIWGITYTPEDSKVFPAAEGKARALAALQASSLEYTCFLTGFLADYFVIPRVKSHMAPLVVVVDMIHDVATVPGSGMVPVVFTYSLDIPKSVIAALGFEHWEKEMYIIGDRMTLNDLVSLAEEVKGAKFQVTYDPMDMLTKGKVTELPSHAAQYPFFPKEQMQGLVAFFGIVWETGKVNLKPDSSLNQMFPHIKTTKLRDLMEQAWKKDE